MNHVAAGYPKATIVVDNPQQSVGDGLTRTAVLRAQSPARSIAAASCVRFATSHQRSV